MSEVNNAICKICGTPYYKCISCKEFRRLYPYKLHTDTAEHFKIYQILQGYSTKVYTKNDAKSRLQNVDLSDMNKLKYNIQKTIKEIMQDDKDIKSDNVNKDNKKISNKKKDILFEKNSGKQV